MPRSIAERMISMLSFSHCDSKPMCQPPSPIAETRSPVRPSVRYSMSYSWPPTRAKYWTHGSQRLRDARRVRIARQPVLSRRDDLRRGLGLGLERRRVRSRSSRASSSAAAISSTPPTSTPRGTPRKSSATSSAAIAPGAIASSSPPSSSAASIPAIPTAAAPAARRSSRRASSRCAGCRPTTSISTGCTAGTGPHADRRNDARARRSGGGGQGALHRLLRHAGVESGAGADHRALPRLGAAGRAADRVLAARADGRRRADSDGARDGAGRDAVVAAQGRRAVGEIHARRTRPRSRPTAASG